MSAPHLILASMSPRRRDLLSRLGIPFTVQPAHLDEDALEASFTGPATGLALHLATHKAAAIAATLATSGTDGEHIILAADTTVLLDGAILGKPHDADDAWAMLARLRDRAHLVCTGIA
nr:Maf family protein [Ktedonobacterales bacterium]